MLLYSYSSYRPILYCATTRARGLCATYGILLAHRVGRTRVIYSNLAEARWNQKRDAPSWGLGLSYQRDKKRWEQNTDQEGMEPMGK
jgi:hypothetical protein